MGLTGALKEISGKKCPHCKKEYGKHSKKQFMKCLYTANYNFYHLLQEYDKVTQRESPVDFEGVGDKIIEEVS
jgi:hypothetical protein